MKAISDIPRNDCLSKVWSLKVPGTAKVFGLRVLIDRLSSKINLEKRGVKLPCNLPLLGNKDAESIQHIMLSCEVAQRQWVKCDKWARLFSVTRFGFQRTFTEWCLHPID